MSVGQTVPMTLNVTEWINSNRMSRMQITTIVLCGLVAMLDGFDIQIMSFVAPVVSKAWNIPPAMLGSIFSAGLFGIMIGSLVSGPLADHFGRKSVIIGSVVLFGLLTLLTVQAESAYSLLVFRFLTGLGLGGAMPNIIALTAEYSPVKRQRTLISFMFIGVPAGGVAGGLLAGYLLPLYGWKSMFYVGGLVPMGVALLLIPFLPESIRFLIVKQKSKQKIASLVRRLGISEADDRWDFMAHEEKLSGFSVVHLFTEGRAVNTILLWIAFFSNLLTVYFVTNWLPTLLHNVGLPLTYAVLGVAVFQAGSIVGSILVGYSSDTRGVKLTIVSSFFLGALSLILLGWGSVSGSLLLVMVLVFIVGLFVIGSQMGINALGGTIYPTSIRSTGISWALGVGRSGSVVGPLIGGALVALKWTLIGIFSVAAIPGVIGGLAIWLMKLRKNE